MWGKASSSEQTEETSRITPAHAGKRSMLYNDDGYVTDHPRTCGEKFALVFCVLTA